MGQSIKLSLKERMIVVVLIRHRDNCVKRRGTCIALLFGESQGGLFVFFCRSPRMCPGRGSPCLCGAKDSHGKGARTKLRCSGATREKGESGEHY